MKTTALILSMMLITSASFAGNCEGDASVGLAFGTVEVDCKSDVLYVDVQVVNFGSTDVAISALSARFTYNESMLANPRIISKKWKGGHSLTRHRGISSYGLIELPDPQSGSKNQLPASPEGKEWKTIARLAFDIVDYAPLGDDRLNLKWNTGNQFPASTMQQYLAQECQPSADIRIVVNNTDRISDFVVDIYPEMAACHDDAGAKVVLDVQGMAPPFTATWSNGMKGLAVEDLQAGAYTVTVKDAGSCVQEHEILIEERNHMMATAEMSAPLTSDVANGYINLDVQGGLQPYSFIWNDGATTEDRNALRAGNYSVKIIDAAGCEIEKSFELTSKLAGGADARTNEGLAMLVYPTPATEEASIRLTSLDGEREVLLTVFDASGKQIYAWSGTVTDEKTTVLDLADYAAGNYTVNVQSEGETLTRQLVVIKENG